MDLEKGALKYGIEVATHVRYALEQWERPTIWNFEGKHVKGLALFPSLKTPLPT